MPRSILKPAILKTIKAFSAFKQYALERIASAIVHLPTYFPSKFSGQ
jgi:hypothetical protein